VLTSVIPYLFSAAAQVYWLATSAHLGHPLHLARDMTVGLLALVFSFWSLQGSGQQAVYYGVIGVLLGVPVYVWHKSRKGEYGEVDTLLLREAVTR
jgi:basic amino acid/polyamine antiporter, APA family